MNCAPPWTEAEKARLKELIELGYKAGDAAAHLPGRSRCSCQTRASLMGLLPPPGRFATSDELDDEMDAAIRDGSWRLVEDMRRVRVALQNLATRRPAESGSYPRYPHYPHGMNRPGVVSIEGRPEVGVPT